MSVRTIFVLVLAGFVVICGGLVVQSGVLQTLPGLVGGNVGSERPQAGQPPITLLQQTAQVQAPPAKAEPNQPGVTGAPTPAAGQLRAAPGEELTAIGGTALDVNIPIGSVDPNRGFKYRLVLDSRGAALRSATFSEFDDRTSKPSRPLTFLSPVEIGGREVLSMAAGELTLLDLKRRFSLEGLDWTVLGPQTLQDGSESVSFEATIVDSQARPAFKLTKTYVIHPDDYLLDVAFRIENLTDRKERVQYALIGPVGLEPEGPRNEMRKVIAGFREPSGQVIRSSLEMKALAKATTPQERSLHSKNSQAAFLWAAAVNKYFAAILVPQPMPGQSNADWVAGKWGTYYNLDPSRPDDSTAQTIGLVLSSSPIALSPADSNNASATYQFQLYLGPKDKSRFDRNPLYKSLGFVQTIDFQGCCCPASIINPLAFGILAIMNWMQGFWPHNYGIVIIVLVLLMRLILHPITKYSQVSMHKMSKLAPRAEEIKKKYVNDKAEMNKKLMELYREQGASPIMGMLPMFIQMPIWIALWSAIYTSIDLRGAAFLPVWITDLSAPDALISWHPFVIPWVKWHVAGLNLLPILMGVAFYLQQKLMPSQMGAASNPQMAQQQKMMNIMMPLLFPLMLYNAPSGVNLYIMSSTFAGVIEQYVIKKHIQEREQQEAQGVVPVTSKTGGKVKKKRPKPFFRT